MQNATPINSSTIVLKGSLVMGVRKGCSGLSAETVCLKLPSPSAFSFLQNASDRGKNPKLKRRKADRSRWMEK
jgi:hypothetical protein